MANQKWLSGRVNGYTPGTLENNWNEERFDIKYLKDSKPLPSQYGHFYNTTYEDLTSNQDKLTFAPDDAVKSAKYRIPGYPGHQPEMDPEYYKQRVNNYETEHRINYLDPRLKTFPFDLKKMMSDELNLNENKTTNLLLSHDLPKSNAPPAPVVQLDRVFSGEPEKRIYKTLSAPPVKKTEEAARADETAPQQLNSNRKPQEEAKENEEELSNFEKLMIRLNKKKGKKTESQSEPQQTQSQEAPREVEEPIPEQPVLIAKENLQREKTAKTVRWQDQNVDK